MQYRDETIEEAFSKHTIFILINAPGALQFGSLKNDLLETKCGQIYKNFNVLKPFCMSFSHFFQIKIGRGHLLERGRLLEGSVSGSGTGPLDSESRDPVPDLETQSLEVQYQIPSQPYEDCLGVR